MTTELSTASSDIVIDELRQCASLLMDKLQSDKYDEALELIQSIMENRDKYFFNSVGSLTRGLHTAIKNFNVDGGKCSIEQAANNECEFNDASSRLEYVIKLTQEAADKTMDKVEECTPISKEMSEEASKLKKEWARLRSREMTPDEFRELYTRLDGFFENLEGNTGKLNENLQSIILEQGYQDLTGQVLKKVMTLITDVEAQLVELMRTASQVEQLVGIDSLTGENETPAEERDIAGEGPQHKAEQRADVVNSQDDVDDLLSSLGF